MRRNSLITVLLLALITVLVFSGCTSTGPIDETMTDNYSRQGGLLVKNEKDEPEPVVISEDDDVTESDSAKQPETESESKPEPNKEQDTQPAPEPKQEQKQETQPAPEKAEQPKEEPKAAETKPATETKQEQKQEQKQETQATTEKTEQPKEEPRATETKPATETKQEQKQEQDQKQETQKTQTAQPTTEKTEQPKEEPKATETKPATEQKQEQKQESEQKQEQKQETQPASEKTEQPKPESKPEPVSRPEPEPASETEEAPEMSYDKAVLAETNFREDKSIYEGYDDTSVLTMYLTVNKGNSADGSDHTWTEINTYSVYDYDNMGVDRYKVEGTLQIDETGNGIDKNSFGYGATVPNVSVQVRGQTSSRSNQKNFKIRIKDGKGEFRGQRTLDLNKHRSDPYRFLNKLCYDLLDPIPQLLGGRTQFVHLYVRDLTEKESPVLPVSSDTEEAMQMPEQDQGEYVDYGLYTMVEQVNRTYLRNHGVDENGHLYKVTFFEWNIYEEVMMSPDDPEFDLADFERYIEVKGDKDPSKLQEVVEKVNNYSIPIDEIVEEHFDVENLSYWMAFNILNGNQDVGARNLFIYSPLNSQKFYMICWDMDASFKRSYNLYHEREDGESWEKGMTKFLGLTLVNRMMKEQKYRDMLTAAVEDVYRHYVNYSTVSYKVNRFKELVKPYLYSEPDNQNTSFHTPEIYDEQALKIPYEAEENYRIFKQSMLDPWPFFVETPTVDTDDNKLILSWGTSYDYRGEDITYDCQLASDPFFENIIYEAKDLKVPLTKTDKLEPGYYYIKVIATNESGYSMDCFDYYKVTGVGKVYGCYCFIVNPDGSMKPYQ